MALTFSLFQRRYVLFKINQINKSLALILAANLLITASVAAPLPSTIISTQKPASQLIDHLSPFIKPPASITAIDHQLVIRANPASIREIEKILSAIDVAPENLTIQIRQSVAQVNPVSARTSSTKTISTRTINTRTLTPPKIATYKSIEGEELIIQQADAPEFLLQWPIQQNTSNPAFSLALTVQRIGERLQLRYRLEESLKENHLNDAPQSIKVEGVLLGHMDSWIDLNAGPSVQHPQKNTRVNLTTERLKSTPLWQIKVQREH